MSSVVFAQEAAAGYSSLIFLAVLIGVFYFLIIRPQRNRAKAQQKMSESVQVGDEIRTIGGIHGRIVSSDEDSVVIAIEDGRMRVSRRAIGARVGDDT